MKRLIMYSALLLMATNVAAQGNIEVSWANIIANKKSDPITASFVNDNGIFISGVPLDKNIQKLKVSINGQQFPATDSSDQTAGDAEKEAFFGNMGAFLTQQFNSGTSVVITLMDDLTVAGATTVDASARDNPVAGRNTAPANRDEYEDAVEAAYGLKIRSGRIKMDRKLNQAREKNIIHIFMDESGNFYYSNLPTTAREDNIYVFHVFYKVDGPPRRFRLEYEGVFDPQFEVYGAEGATQEVAGKNSTGQPTKVMIREQTLGAIGPFTGSFEVRIFEVGKTEPILNKTVNVAKLHHVTLSAGLYGTLLRYPENIGILARPATGDSTLVADDPTSRGFITVMLTWYPKPRNLLFPSGNWKERIGFNLGTSISKKLAENFFGGISYDIARGLSVTGGIHYGRQNYVVGFSNFEYGEDKFSGNLDNRVKKRWNANVYVGLNMDFRLLTYIFNPAAAPGN